MKHTVQKNLIKLFSLLLLVNTFLWSNYYLGVKPGNYLLLGAFFLFSVVINTIATNESKTGSKNLLIIISTIGALCIPFLGNFTYLSLYLTVIILLAGFLVPFPFSGKSVLESVFIISGAAFLSLFIPVEFLKVINIVLPILTIGILLSAKFKFVDFAQNLLIILIGIFSSLEMAEKRFYENEYRFKGEIILQDAVEDSLFTLTRTKGDWLLYRGRDQILSSADYFMLYESLIHSAFRYHPKAKDILVVSPYTLFFLEELNAYPETNVSWINEEKEKSELINRIVRKGHPREVEFNVLLSTNRKFDLIFLDKGNPSDPYLGMINEDGLIVKILEDPGENTAPDHFISKDFHIALPTNGEHYWAIYARDSLEMAEGFDKNYLNTEFFQPEVMSLISNFGKFY